MAKRNLLLVDADPRSLRVLEVSLRKAGYSVATCGAVDDALELIGLSEPDLIISDTRLSGKDGLSLARELKSRAAHVPLMFLSSDPSVETKVKSLELGIEDYLTKPVYMREILTRVSLIMERSEREGLGRSAKTRMAGSLEDMGLVDLLQTIDLSRKSGVLKLSHGQRRGSMSFSEGRVIDAELGELQGEGAIYRFLLWSEGTFELEFREVRGEDKLGVPTQALLMEGVRRLDEWGRIQEQLPGLHAVLEVNHAELAQRLGEVDDDLNGVLRAFDGQRDLIQVLEASDGDDLANLTAISKLFFDGFLAVRHRTDPSEARVGAGSDPFLGYVPVESAPPPGFALRDHVGTSGAPVSASDSSDASGAVPSASALPRAVSESPVAAVIGTPLAVLQLKRVSAINENTLRPLGSARELGPESVRTDDGRYESSQPRQAIEGEDDMAKRGKRKERSDERAVGNVIPLHPARGELGASGEVATVSVAREEPEPPLASPAHEDDHPDEQDFFARPERAAPAPVEAWHDLEPAEPEHDHEAALRGRTRGMAWTGAIAVGGLLLIGVFLLYNKVLMPTPEELVSGPVALPTPEMLQPSPALVPEAPSEPSQVVTPTPAQVVEQVAPQVAAPGPLVPAQVPTAAPSDSYEAELAEARKLGLRRGAEQAYLAALAQRPGGAEALSGLAMLYLNQGKNAQAKDRAQQAITADATNAEAWIVLGAAEDALGRGREAREAYAKCAALPTSKYVLECKRMLH